MKGGYCVVVKQCNKDKALPRAVTYLRFAVADTDGHREAVAKHICQRRANELGAIVVSTYVDVASGWTDDRPQLRWMLSDLAETSEITYVVVPEHSTIARNMHVYGRIIWKIQQAGARLVVATVPLEDYRDMKPNQLGVLHAVADWATNGPQRCITERKGEAASTFTLKELGND
jgi:DNA invertase Pin-like site-specific DNA recombinase